jgi:hypothetical protein
MTIQAGNKKIRSIRSYFLLVKASGLTCVHILQKRSSSARLVSFIISDEEREWLMKSSTFRALIVSCLSVWVLSCRPASPTQTYRYLGLSDAERTEIFTRYAAGYLCPHEEPTAEMRYPSEIHHLVTIHFSPHPDEMYLVAVTPTWDPHDHCFQPKSEQEVTIYLTSALSLGIQVSPLRLWQGTSQITVAPGEEVPIHVEVDHHPVSTQVVCSSRITDGAMTCIHYVIEPTS